MLVKLLLDENISPAAARALCAAGVDAYHVRDRDLLGVSDHALLDRAYAEDRVVVTINVGDFEALVGDRELHAGVVLIEQAGLLRDEQIALLLRVAHAIRDHGSLINEVLRVSEDGAVAFEQRGGPVGDPST